MILTMLRIIAYSGRIDDTVERETPQGEMGVKSPMRLQSFIRKPIYAFVGI